jgi:hypothetical protein
MIIKQVHIDFWNAKHAQPSWMQTYYQKNRKLQPKLGVPNIHGCINAHAGINNSCFNHVHNMIIFLKGERRRGAASLMPMLQRLADDPGTIINPEKRSAFARKWLKRLQRDIDSRSSSML